MTNCQACGTEILHQDRFCKNCGAPAAVSVEDLADTRQFDPSVRAAAAVNTGSLDPGSSFSFPGAATYPMAQASPPSTHIASQIKNLLQRNIVWLVVFMLLFLFVGTGLVIGRGAMRARREERAARARAAEKNMVAKQAAQAESDRRAFQEAVQNAMGFTPGIVSAEEYPGIQGIFVSSLTSDDSPAGLARIQAGDVLIELNGEPVRNNKEMMKVLNAAKPGSDISVKLYRDDEDVSSRIKIANQSTPPFQPKTDPRDQGFLGVGDVDRRCCIPATKSWGLQVHRIIDNSPADLAGIQLGDVISEFDGHIVRTPEELARRIRNAKPRTKVKVKFNRGNAERTLDLILGHGW
jgi:membrane-associated protease RseP (regulator of RpoE activity)